jgi:hypothetical protein
MLYTNKSSVSPSQRLGIKNHWLAYQFDELVQLFGQRVEGAVKKEKTEAQKEIVFREMLGIEMPQQKIQVQVLSSLPGVTVKRRKKKQEAT